jgi:predicted dehydrogenase
MTTVAVVGAGNWGRNLVRNFHTIPESRLKWVVDVDEGRLSKMAALFPGIRTTTDQDDVLADDEVDAVVVASPAITHHPIGKACLLAGKHAYVEKPLALTVGDAEDLARTADEAGRVLMTGHLLLYHPAVLALKELIDSGELGDLYYLYSQRVNLGVIRKDENALWSFAPHDLSVMLFLLEERPLSVSARGAAYLQEGVEDVAFVNVRFSGGRMGQVQLSWLDPNKLRKFTVVGSRKMAVFDDVEPQEKVRVYDKGADVPSEYASFGDYIGLRFGDVWIPRIDTSEPLRLECEHFLECVRTGATPRSDARSGVEVVSLLDAATRSLQADGSPVNLDAGPRGAKLSR